jgi:hypothetical protein
MQNMAHSSQFNGYCIWNTQGEMKCSEGFEQRDDLNKPCKKQIDCSGELECIHKYNPTTKKTAALCSYPEHRCTPPNKPCKCAANREAKEIVVEKRKHYYCTLKQKYST